MVIGDGGVEMGVGGLPAGVRGPPTEQAGDPPDVGVDGEALPAETEEEDAGGGLGADAGKGQDVAVGVVGGGVVQVFEAVAAVAGVHLFEDVDDDLGLDRGQASASDGSFELGPPAPDDGFPVVAASVDAVHAQLGAAAVRVAGVLR